MILVDFQQILYASLMCTPGFFKSGGTPEEDLLRHIAVNSIRANRMKFHSSYGEIVLCCEGGQNWRREIFPGYKHRRRTNKEESSTDWNKIHEVVGAIRNEMQEFFPYPVVSCTGAEGDDVIATLSRSVPGKHLILSGDADFCQLHGPNIDQYNPVQKKKVDLGGISPSRYLAEKILSGDSGDDVPNVHSPDDTFVTPGKKQVRTPKNFAKNILDSIPAGKSPRDFLPSVELQKNWDRNKKMIDLSETPEEIQKNILTTFEVEKQRVQEIGRSRIFSYLASKKMQNLLEHLSEF